MYKIICLFLVCTNIFASEVPMQKFFDFVEREQDSYFSPPTNGGVCAETDGGGESFNLLKCVESICGDRSRTLGIDSNPYMILACAEDPDLPLCKGVGYKDYYKDLKELRSSIEEYFPLEQKFVESQLKAAKSYLMSPQNISSRLDSFNLNLADLFTLTFSSPEFFEAREKEEGGIQVKFKNIKKLKRKLRSNFNLRRSDERAAIKALKLVFEDTDSIFGLEYFGVDFVMNKVLTEKERENPISSLRAKKFEALSKIKKVLGEDTIDPESIQGSLSDLSSDSETLLREVLVLRALSKGLNKSELMTLSKGNFTRANYYNNPRYSPDWSDPSNDEKFLSTLQHIENQLQFYDGMNTNIDSHELNAYMMTILNSLEQLPNEEELSSAKRESLKYLDTFFESFKTEFSSKSTNDIKSEVGSLHLNYSDTKKQYLGKLKQWLKARKGILQEYKKLTDSDQKEKASELLGRGHLQDLIMGSGTTSGLNEFVDELAVNPIPDFYLGAYNGIKVGPLAIKDFKNKGKQILAHELGHHVGHFMEKHSLSKQTTKKFKETRECLAGAHQEGAGDEIKMKLKANDRSKVKWKENKYSEEDFADWIASKASGTNMACLFVERLDLSKKNYDYFKNEVEDDTHSSPVFRLLNMELNQKGRLPASCQTDRVKLCPGTN